MEINTAAVYTEKTLKDFIRFSIFRGKRHKTRRIVDSILVPLFLLAGVLLVFFENPLLPETDLVFKAVLPVFYPLRHRAVAIPAVCAARRL